jgi:hypothetical protein
VLRSSAVLTLKAIRPTRFFQCSLALFFSTILIKQLSQTHTWLKLNLIDSHGSSPVRVPGYIMRPVEAHYVSPAEV